MLHSLINYDEPFNFCGLVGDVVDIITNPDQETLRGSYHLNKLIALTLGKEQKPLKRVHRKKNKQRNKRAVNKRARLIYNYKYKG